MCVCFLRWKIPSRHHGCFNTKMVIDLDDARGNAPRLRKPADRCLTIQILVGGLEHGFYFSIQLGI